MPRWLIVFLTVILVLVGIGAVTVTMHATGWTIRSPIVSKTDYRDNRVDRDYDPSSIAAPDDRPSEQASPPAPTPVCEEPGSVFVEQLGKCIFSMTNPVEVQRYAPDKDVDPRCKGKPAGFKYQEKITDPSRPGRVGTVNRVCGRRPTAGQ